jgi:hypothetical protein
MRIATYLPIFALCSACSEASPDTGRSDDTPREPPFDQSGDPGAAALVPPPMPEPEPLGPPIGAAPEPTVLASDVVLLMGVTSDGWAVFRNPDGIVAVPADGSAAEPVLVSAALGNVLIRGRVVFVFSGVDWTTNIGALTIWTATHGSKSVGNAIYGDDAVFASSDGAWLGWIGNPTTDPGIEPTADVHVASSDFAQDSAILAGIGSGSETTCRPRLGFVGTRVIAATCAPGQSSASLAAFDAPAFGSTELATGASTAWSTDQSGESVFFTDASGGAWLSAIGGGAQKLDHGVGWGTPLPDASAVLYVVGDQLRRADAPDFSPVPIITNGFVARAAMSPDHAHALYSTKVTYEDGVHRDLLVTTTHTLNHVPVRLVDAPIAELSRSAFTTDGRWTLYKIDDVLHARSVVSFEGRTIEGVDTVVSAHGSRIVYSKNRSGPETYPITADLEVADPSAEGEPVTLRTATTDGRSFYLSADGKQVFYVVPADGATPSKLYVQGVP